MRDQESDSRLGSSEGRVAAIALVRRSSTDADKQVASLVRQRAEIIRANPNIEKWWEEEGSGTLDDRNSIADILDWCSRHRRPKSDPGKIYVWEWSRFARPVHRDEGHLVSDPLMGIGLLATFWNCGWKLVDVSVGEQEGLIHLISAALGMERAGAESVTLQQRVRSGKRHKFKAGYHSGPAPWFAVRMDSETGRILASGEVASQKKLVLCPVPGRIAAWLEVAEKLLRGFTYSALAEHLSAKGIPTSDRGRCQWSVQHVRSVLTNIKIIGYLEQATEGSRSANTSRRLPRPRRVRAKWEPMVPVKLFLAVQREVRRRKAADTRHRPTDSAFLLRPSCALCERPFTICSTQGYHYYRHPAPRVRSGIHRADGECCTKMYYVRADRLDGAVWSLLLSAHAAGELESGQSAVDEARSELKRLKEEERQLAATCYHWMNACAYAVAQGFPPEHYIDRLGEAQGTLQLLRHAVAEAKASVDDALDLFAVRKEPLESIEILQNSSVEYTEAHRRAVDLWVDRVELTVEPDPRWRKRGRGREQFGVIHFHRRLPPTTIRLT
jgi:hypothetical protein